MYQADARQLDGNGRDLQQENDDVIVAVVNTMQELIQALEGNANHIQVQSHIDAASNDLIRAEINGENFFHLLPPQRGQTHSIVGNCTEEPPAKLLGRLSGVPLEPLAPNQCLILAKAPLFAMSESNVLISNFYIRYVSDSGFAFEPPASSGSGTSLSWLFHVHGGNVWASNLTVQGDGSSEIGSVIIFPTAHAMFFNSMFLHAVTSQTNGVPVTIRSSPTTFVKCDFSGHVSPPNGPVIYAETGAPVWVQESTFDNNTADYKFGSRGGAQFFNDDDLDVEFGGGVTEPARPLSEAGDEIKLLAWTEQFISDIEPLLESDRVRLLPVAEALETPGGVGVYEEPEIAAGGDNGGASGGLIAGIIIALLVAILVAAIVAVLLVRRRRAANDAPPKHAAPGGAPAFPAHGGPAAFPGYGGAPAYSHHGPYGPVNPVSGHPSGVYMPGSSAYGSSHDPYAYGPPVNGKGGASYNVATGAFGDTRAYGALPSQHPINAHAAVVTPDADAVLTEELTINTLDGRTATSATSAGSASRARPHAAASRGVTGDPGSPVGLLPANASLDDKLERIHKQLDGMHAVGQGIVQFARGVSDGLDYALKFFVSKNAFDAEGELYRDAVLGPLLPKIEGVTGNEGGEEGDAHGTPLPPFIAMEKGEALDEWSRRAKPDLFHSVAMLANIAKKLASMHGAGYVHRDLKPGNVMWLPRENRWTIIDFGCVTRIGEETGIAYSLRYAAPEILRTLAAGERKMVPQPSLDAWSLGVMAYELLTGQPAFQVMVHGAQDITKQLLGETELPWEGSRADPAVMRKLRTLRRPIMACLDRDPEKRPTMQAVCEMCDDIFGTRTVKPDA